MKKIIHIDITPKPKPRMVRSDAWKKRPVVMSYWAYKDELVLKARAAGVSIDDSLSVIFILPMPKSWKKKEKERMNGKPHQQTPDTDNLVKALKDCLLKQDCMVYREKAEKYWGYEGKIIFRDYEDN